MSRPRLVVIEGPDVGAHVEIPDGGGTIGRGEESFVRLTDLAVSRAHCAIAQGERGLTLVDPGSRNNTWVNGRAVTEHVLVEGDEIALGRTRLVFVAPNGRMPVLISGAGAAITLERLATQILDTADMPIGGAGRARRHLAALARLGDGLRGGADEAGVGAAACGPIREALDAARAVLYLRDAEGTLRAAAASSEQQADAKQTVEREVLDKVLNERKVVLVGQEQAGREAIAAPVRGGDAVVGMLYVDRPASPRAAWQEPELDLLTCVAHLVGAALDSAASRETLARENRALEERLGGAPEFVGESSAANKVRALAGKAGPTDSTVLVLGESGVGKELVAAAIHKASRRARGPFVTVNCGALSESVLESELFGHEKGAFTGAIERKLGRFELANGGTLFLDEVGEIPARSQAKFLRVLEERKLERVGGTRSIAVDVRVVAATNRDLERMMRQGEFREDLYYRLSVIRIEVPPLRERQDDIARIAQGLLARLRLQIGRRVIGFATDGLEALARYPWPGNVRELKNAIEHALVLGDGERIRATDLPPHVLCPPRVPQPRGDAAAPPPAAQRTLYDVEREAVLEALAAAGGNKVQAAARLGINRSTLYKKLRDYGIGPADDSADEAPGGDDP